MTTTYATEAFLFEDQTTIQSLSLSDKVTRLVFVNPAFGEEDRVLCIFSDMKVTVCLDYKWGTVSIAHYPPGEHRFDIDSRFSHLERAWPSDSRPSERPHGEHESIMDDAVLMMWFVSRTPERVSSSRLVYSASWDNDVPKVIRDREGRIDVAKSVSAACPYLQWFAGAN